MLQSVIESPVINLSTAYEWDMILLRSYYEIYVKAA